VDDFRAKCVWVILVEFESLEVETISKSWYCCASL